MKPLVPFLYLINRKLGSLLYIDGAKTMQKGRLSYFAYVKAQII